MTYSYMDVAWAFQVWPPTNHPVGGSEWIGHLLALPPSEPVFVPDIPVLEQPLIPDDLRLRQLLVRLSPHSVVNQFSLQTIVDLVYQQAEVEKKIEASLILDGISPIHFFSELNDLRGFLFYSRGYPISAATLARYLRQITRLGTRQSIPYRRVKRAILNYQLFWSYSLHFRNI